MKAIITTVLVLTVAITGVCQAQEKTGWKPSGSLSLSLHEKYITYTSSRNVYDDKNLCGAIKLDLTKGLSLGISKRMDMSDTDQSSTAADNLDYCLSWNGKLGEYKINAMAMLLNFYPLEHYLQGNRTIYSISIARGYTFGDHTITPNLMARWWSPSQHPKNGHLVAFCGINHSWKIGSVVTLAHDTKLVLDSAIGQESDVNNLFLRWSPGLKWQLSKNVTVILPSLTVLTPLSNPRDGRDQIETSWGCKVSYKF